mmetsp:Transcript_34226/g.83838  ORF Transcript_34226/g.83838 Transcript_34226/m.83838 type:complete len:206 (-) Transcript_34226:634-1251(-)
MLASDGVLLQRFHVCCMWNEKQPCPRTNEVMVGVSAASSASLRHPATTMTSALGMVRLAGGSADSCGGMVNRKVGLSEEFLGACPSCSVDEITFSSRKCILMKSLSLGSTRSPDSSFIWGFLHTGHAPRTSVHFEVRPGDGDIMRSAGGEWLSISMDGKSTAPEVAVGFVKESSNVAAVMHLKQNRCLHGRMTGLLRTSSQMGQQ